ncbi:uncharacterized protein LOC122960249 [Acropora millepora]|uniref:uncharacterized protein LOC122960249 n=1 Tax=Acropora millepora TaxID=45264 RepID=UPI001CF500AC|nr:uncharacterized protein LOC122960249 [Acropora millepora]
MAAWKGHNEELKGAEEKSFQKLKELVAQANTLAYFRGDCNTRIRAEIGPHVLDAVLTEVQDEEWSAIAYASRNLSDVERRRNSSFVKRYNLPEEAKEFMQDVDPAEAGMVAPVSELLGEVLTALAVSRSDVCRSDDSNDVGFRFDVFQSDDKEIEFSRSDVCRSDDSNNVGFRFDVFQSDDKEIEFSRFDACPTDGSKNVSLRLDIDSDDAAVFSAYRDDQEFLVDSGQNSETSPSCKVTSEPSEPDVLHSDALERVGIGPKREAHNLCNTDCSDEGPQYTYTAADVTIAETHVDIDGVIPQIASMEETPSPSQDTCNSTPPGLPPDSLYVHGIIQNTPSFMLVDTGASVTAVSSSLFARISPPVHLDPAPLPYIRTVSGEHLPVQGIAKLTFIFGDVSYSFESLVIDQLTYPVVLGRDFLLSLGSVIDMQNHTLTFLGQEPISLHSNRLTRSSQTDEHVTVHAHATYILPPLTESVIPVYPKRLLPTGTTGLIEPSSKLLTRYQIGGATQLVSLSEENTFPFRLLNPTSRPITIYRCSTLGSFTPAASEMSVITTEDNSDASATSKCDPSDQNETDVPLDLSDSTLTPPEKAQLLSLINEYRDNFATSPEELGRTGLVTHKIDTGDQPPIRQRPYRVSHQQRTIIEEHVTDMLNRGIIQPSVSPWASPVVLVKKKDNTDRFCVDFRRLNAVTRKDSYPLPRIDDALDALNGTRYFSTMDLMSGYWQVEMDPESREHTAFTTYGGLYEFLVMPFGLTNAPSTYQRLMECVLRNLTYKICLIYLDDILVYSKTFSDHLLHLRQVFERLRAANLKLKPSKCRFACHRVHYLGHVVSAAGIAPDEDKIEARDGPFVFNSTTQHGNADALSRRSYDLPVPTLSAYDIPGVPTARIRDAQRRDPDLADLISYLENWTLPADNGSARRLLLTVDDYFLSPDGLLFHLWTPPAHRRPSTVQQLVIPTAMRYEILTWGHDDPTAAHFGTTKTYEKLRTRYYWRKMFSDVQHWCRSCADCAMRKTPRNRHKAPLLPIPVESAFERVAVDAMGPFPPSTSGKRYVIVFTDYLTKWTEAFAVPTIGADVVARLLVEELLPRHGAPRTLLSDRGSNFLSTLVKEVCRLLNTKKLNTTAYHPQTDGLVERFNNTLAESISMYVSTDQKDWDNYIPSILFAYRVSPQASTGDSPFYLLYGREPRLPPDVSLLPLENVSSSVAEHRSRIVNQLEAAQAIARTNIQRAQQQMKAQYDKAAVDAPFEVGQRVWVFTPKPRKGLSKKLRHMWSGPFRICTQLSPVHYQLRTCDNRLVATVVHANRMKPFYDPADRPILPPIDDDPNAPNLLESDLPDDSFEQPSHPAAEAISPDGALDATPNTIPDDSSPPDDDNEDDSETDI